jgi:CHAD domain-containing protein
LRKARSLTGLFRKAFPTALYQHIKTTLAELARSTNTLRELEVFLLRRSDYSASLPDNLQADLDSLYTRIAEQRLRGWEELVLSLGSADYRHRLDALHNLLQQPPALATAMGQKPIGMAARRKIINHYGKIVAMRSEVLADASAEALHELRIEIKKLRYLMEFYAEHLATQSIKKLIQKTKLLQQILGDINDCAVQARFLAELPGLRADNPGQTALTDSLLALLSQRQTVECARVPGALSELCGTAMHEKFDRLFGAVDSSPTC